MRKTKQVKKVRKPGRRKPVGFSAVAEEAPKRKRGYVSLEDVLENYKPLKKPVTLRLDADIIAWFKKSGHGYQTRINRALRKLMSDERKTGAE